jgi:HSP20 family molecular chaperone IbpA
MSFHSNHDHATFDHMLRQGAAAHAAVSRQAEGMAQRFLRMHQIIERQKWQHAREIQKLREQQHYRPMAELAENEDCIRLTVDLPGVPAKDLDVQVEKGVLTITASRKTTSMDGNHVVKKQTIKRRYAINMDVVDDAKLAAHLQHGVLTVTAPKKKQPPESCIHRIVVQSESDPDEDDERAESTNVKMIPVYAHGEYHRTNIIPNTYTITATKPCEQEGHVSKKEKIQHESEEANSSSNDEEKIPATTTYSSDSTAFDYDLKEKSRKRVRNDETET